MVLQRGATGIILLEFRYTPVLLSTKPYATPPICRSRFWIWLPGVSKVGKFEKRAFSGRLS